MIHLLVLALAALHLQDPAGDAIGDGTLVPPTAPIYANTAAFDLQSVTLTSDPKLTVRLELGSLSDAGKLPNGFSGPIIEVYLDTAPGGAQQLLPGSSMSMPPKHGWEVALRATGDEAFAVEAQPQGSPASWPRLPVAVQVQGNTITLRTTLVRPDRAELYALTGVYDPFTQSGWRPLSPTVSPWAFSSPTQQVPVVDLLASNQSAQRREIDSGVLAPDRSPFQGIGWLVLMVLGLITAAAGLVVRRRVRAAPVDAADGGDSVPAEGAAREGTTEPSERFLNEAEEGEPWPDAEVSVDRAVAGTPGATPHGIPDATPDAVAARADASAAAREDGAVQDRTVDNGVLEGNPAKDAATRSVIAQPAAAAPNTVASSDERADEAVDDAMAERADDSAGPGRRRR